MRDDRLIDAYRSIQMDPAEKEAVLARILEAKAQSQSTMSFRKKPRSLRAVLPAACAAALILCAVALPQYARLSTESGEDERYMQTHQTEDDDASAADALWLSDASGEAVLADLTEEEVRQVNALLSRAVSTELTTAQLDAIADAKEQGDYFQLMQQSEDGHTHSIQIFPTLSLLLDGSDGYILSGELVQVLQRICDWRDPLQ